MEKFIITVSLRDVQKAQSLLSDNRGISEYLEHTYTNVWESKGYDEEEWRKYPSQEFAYEQMEYWLDEVKEFLDDNDIEYEVETN